jgi:hypothetical protein
MKTTREDAPRRRAGGQLRPLTVTPRTAQRILDVGNTKFWELVKAGKIKMVEVGGRRMAVYSSLEALADPEPSDRNLQPRRPG